MNKSVSVVLLLALYIPAAHADWALGGYLETMSFDQGKATAEGIEDSALVLGFVADNFYERFMISMGLGLISYEDNEEFEQLIEVDGGFDDGDIRTESSSATGILIHIDAGPRFQIGESRSSYFAFKGGFSNVVASERSISNCSNCYSEDIDIDGGAYVQAALGAGSDRVGVAFKYSHYLDEEEGIASSLGFAVSAYF